LPGSLVLRAPHAGGKGPLFLAFALAWRLHGLRRTRKVQRPQMDTTLLISLSQQIASATSMDVIANNLANASTPGFQRDEPTFQEYVVSVDPVEGQVGPQQLSYVKDMGMIRDLSEGRMDTTGAPFDMAIHGSGYFVVQTANGERYTRNGHFGLDASGQIVTSNGDPVQGDGGAITVTPDDGNVTIAQDGTVTGKNGQIGRIRVVDFANPRLLSKEGASLYSTDQSPVTADNFKLQSGMLEASNVQPVIEISHMIEVMRAYQATANLTQTQEDLDREAIQKLGGTPA
jgi:flagellar basal-body rod protein FlgF